ncbi:MAG TPA: hypothetical protein VFO39_12320 [Candidatus Sulfotelmatobacter sp.]|nr:hypothetical protein [Candidatus Sulfotelmatobacter sp.]
MPKSRVLPKAKRTFSLSRDVVSYLEAVRREKKRPSLSSVVEEMVRQQQQAKEMERISAAFTHYYDSLTPEQIAEDRAWGDFAATQFPDEK